MASRSFRPAVPNLGRRGGRGCGAPRARAEARLAVRGRHWAALAALLCAGPALAEDPVKIAIGPESPKGALLFKIPPMPITHLLMFQRDGASATTGYWVRIKGRPLSEGERFIATVLPPGRYRLDAVYLQLRWVGCLHATVPTFTVEPGRIAYLGSLDTRPTLASIQRSAQAHENLKASTGQWYRYRIDAGIPRLADRDPEGLARAEGFVRRDMPKSSATVALAELGPGQDAGSTQTALANRCNYAR